MCGFVGFFNDHNLSIESFQKTINALEHRGPDDKGHWTDLNKKIFVGGFSQGAALSLSLIFERGFPIEGCVALSGYMPNSDHYLANDPQSSKVFISHGKNDNAISFDSFTKSMNFLEKKNVQCTKYIGDFGHTITKEVTNELIDWIIKIL
mgnify:CR=1 FL=1